MPPLADGSGSNVVSPRVKSPRAPNPWLALVQKPSDPLDGGGSAVSAIPHSLSEPNFGLPKALQQSSKYSNRSSIPPHRRSSLKPVQPSWRTESSNGQWMMTPMRRKKEPEAERPRFNFAQLLQDSAEGVDATEAVARWSQSEIKRMRRERRQAMAAARAQRTPTLGLGARPM